jgi:hypothetical protein
VKVCRHVFIISIMLMLCFWFVPSQLQEYEGTGTSDLMIGLRVVIVVFEYLLGPVCCFWKVQAEINYVWYKGFGLIYLEGKSRDSPVSVVTRLRAERLVFVSWQGQYYTASQPRRRESKLSSPYENLKSYNSSWAYYLPCTSLRINKK